jgi:perosamine synthetase
MNRISDLERKYVLEALDNEFRTSLNSVFVSKLEQQFAEKFNSSFAIAHVNGTATMHTALAALGVGENDEVIVPPLTMSSTALSVLHNQSIPVFADVDPNTFTIDPKAVRDCITPRTKAIITVSLYGLSPDYDEIVKICQDHQLFLIEDNAECFLGYYKGKVVGLFGEFSSFSFQASKHMTCGEGGILLTNNEKFANYARRFNSLGYAAVSSKKGKISKRDVQDPDYDRHITVGFNYRMSEVNAAVALGQLERLEDLVDQRKKVAGLFDSATKDFSFIRPQSEPEGYVNSYWTYAMVLETDNQPYDWYTFRDLFQQNGGDHYYAAWKLSYNEPLFQNIIQKASSIWQEYKPGLCPNAEYLQPRMIQLKTNYWDISEAERQAEILRNTLLEFSG